jgi:hypothetical protein
MPWAPNLSGISDPDSLKFFYIDLSAYEVEGKSFYDLLQSVLEDLGLRIGQVLSGFFVQYVAVIDGYDDNDVSVTTNVRTGGNAVSTGKFKYVTIGLDENPEADNIILIGDNNIIQYDQKKNVRISSNYKAVTKIDLKKSVPYDVVPEITDLNSTILPWSTGYAAVASGATYGLVEGNGGTFALGTEFYPVGTFDNGLSFDFDIIRDFIGFETGSSGSDPDFPDSLDAAISNPVKIYPILKTAIALRFRIKLSFRIYQEVNGSASVPCPLRFSLFYNGKYLTESAGWADFNSDLSTQTWEDISTFVNLETQSGDKTFSITSSPIELDGDLIDAQLQVRFWRTGSHPWDIYPIWISDVKVECLTEENLTASAYWKPVDTEYTDVQESINTDPNGVLLEKEVTWVDALTVTNESIPNCWLNNVGRRAGNMVHKVSGASKRIREMLFEQINTQNASTAKIFSGTAIAPDMKFCDLPVLDNIKMFPMSLRWDVKNAQYTMRSIQLSQTLYSFKLTFLASEETGLGLSITNEEDGGRCQEEVGSDCKEGTGCSREGS